jgi:hypothetical protein
MQKNYIGERGREFLTFQVIVAPVNWLSLRLVVFRCVEFNTLLKRGSFEKRIQLPVSQAVF